MTMFLYPLSFGELPHRLPLKQLLNMFTPTRSSNIQTSPLPRILSHKIQSQIHQILEPLHNYYWSTFAAESGVDLDSDQQMKQRRVRIVSRKEVGSCLAEEFEYGIVGPSVEREAKNCTAAVRSKIDLDVLEEWRVTLVVSGVDVDASSQEPLEQRTIVKFTGNVVKGRVSVGVWLGGIGPVL